MEASARQRPDFREAFCRQFGCRPEGFERRLLIRCLPLLWRLPGALWLLVSPRSFARELGMLSRLGSARDPALLRPELEGYAYENERDRPWRVAVFGIRLSRRRCLRIFLTVMGREIQEDLADRPSLSSAP